MSGNRSEFVVVFVLMLGLTLIMGQAEDTWDIVGSCRRYQQQDAIYYTAGSKVLTKDDAQKACERRHPDGGRLVSVLGSKIKDCLNDVSTLTFHVYWTGGQMRRFLQWTWVDGTTDTSWLTIMPSDVTGFARLAVGNNEQEITYRSIPLTDHPSTIPSNPYGLCQRNKNECFKSTSSECYFNVSATRWFEARNACLLRSGDLAVLSRETARNLLRSQTILKSHAYYIGLRNVKFTWSHVFGAKRIIEAEAKYTNWLDSAPRTADYECVVLRNRTYWDVEKCTELHKFICEYSESSSSSNNRPTSFMLPTDTLHNTTRTSTQPPPGLAVVYVIVGVVLVALVATGIVIVACVVRMKLSTRPCRKPEPSQSYDGLQKKHKDGVCETVESTYANISTENQKYCDIDSVVPRPAARQPKSSGCVIPPAAVSDGAVYASILPVDGHRDTDNEETNEYETPVQPIVYASFDIK